MLNAVIMVGQMGLVEQSFSPRSSPPSYSSPTKEIANNNSKEKNKFEQLLSYEYKIVFLQEILRNYFLHFVCA